MLKLQTKSLPYTKSVTAPAVVSLGYRKDSDFNAKLPKSFLEETVITQL
jgi:nitroreductase/dihydropteridine reductase